MDRIKFFLLALAVLVLGVTPGRAAERSITLVGPIGVVKPGESFAVDVHLTNVGEAINVAEVSLRFPADHLRVDSVGREQSAFTLWPQLPTWDNTQGTVHAEGGVPNGLYASDARVITIHFTALETGSATVSLDAEHSAVFLNGSQGDRAAFPVATLTIDVASEFTQTVTITSSTHPDPARWSTDPTVVVDWTPIADAQYSYSFSVDGRTPPDDTPDASKGPLTFSNLSDNRYTFAIKARPTGSPWTPISERDFLIDATPPESFTLDHPDPSAVGGEELIAWNAEDRTSGIDHATLTVDGRMIGTVTSPTRIRPAWEGKTLVVSVYDQAGNVRSASWKATPQPHAATPVWPWVAGGVGILGLSALLSFLFRRIRR